MRTTKRSYSSARFISGSAAQHVAAGRQRAARRANDLHSSRCSDGVGGRAAGEEASRLALEEVTQYVSQSTRCFYQEDPHSATFVDLLEEAAMRCHQRVLERAERDRDLRGMATTLTLWIGVWPWIYLLQVGDSRYCLYRHGKLMQITRDQTMAQELVDRAS